MTLESSATSNLTATKQALLAQRLRQRPGADSQTISRRAAGVSPPLSFAQERLWFMEQFAPGTLAYTIPFVLRLRGPLRDDVLRRSFDEIVARHETLRTRYPRTDDGKPILAIAEYAVSEFAVVEVASFGDAMDQIKRVSDRPFDLETGPLLRVLLVRIALDDHLVYFCAHHSISDGWSTELIINELQTIYGAFAAGQPSPLPQLLIQYGDFAAWQRGQLTGAALEREVAYWRHELSGVEPLDLPTDRPRPPQQTFVGKGHGFTIDKEVVDGLTVLARDNGATLYMILLAAFEVLLARQSGQREFAVGSPIAGRPHNELEDLVGMFVNVLALRARLEGDPTFVELLGRTRETCLQAFEHQEMPFAQLVTELRVNRDVQRSPVFQVILAVQNYSMAQAAAQPAGLSVERIALEASATRFDLELFLMEHPDMMHGSINYNCDLFDVETIERMARRFDRLLRSILANPLAHVSDLEMLDPTERALVVERWNDTARPYPSDTTLHAMIEQQVDRSPDAIALRFEGATLTYAELDRRANQVAHRLAASGVGVGSLVGVCAERSLELVTGLLGVLKAGAAYVPLDPDYPPDRLAFMLEDAQAPVLLTQRNLALPSTDAAVVLLDDPAAWADSSTDRPSVEVGPGDAAYMIYTSGSTGKPKGVPNAHRGIVNRLDWMQKTYRLDASDVVLQKTPASFDVSVWEFFWPLLAGAMLVVAKPGGHKDVGYLRETIERERVTTMHFVPSMLSVFLAESTDDAPSLRRIICSGEALPATLAELCLAQLAGAELYNLYGPTEAAIDVTSWQCRPGDTSVPIGAPIQNIQIYILDERLRPVPIGAPGELHIGGVGLALGYHNRAELTAEKFVDSPYGRLYKTGDLARWRHDGVVEYLGRIDFQVKLRGLRIELGEIEAALRAQPGVDDAVVVVRDGRLIAYLTGAPGEPAELRPALKATLPDYMVPNVFLTLQSMPLTPNGKLDRKALPAPVLTRDRGAKLTAPTTSTEVLVAEIWREILAVETVGIDDDFFELGGHSLLATQVVARIRKTAVGSPVSVMDLFKHPTIRDLATLVDTSVDDRGPRLIVNRLTRNKSAVAPSLSFVCVPYGGGSAVVYQPLADALPVGYDLWSVSIPGHDVGVQEEHLAFADLARRCADEVLANVSGPIALYGHCAVGSALVIEIARLLETAGRRLVAVYIGAMFPFARPKGRLTQLVSKCREAALGHRVYENWLTGLGADMADIDPEQRRVIIANMRRDSVAAEDYFTARLAQGAQRLEAPIISVMGERDPVSDLYQERYQEWGLFTDSAAIVLVEEAGHFFLKYRADELAEIVTKTHGALANDEPLEGAGWALYGVTKPGQLAAPSGPQPSMRRFLIVAAGQLVSILGSALTEFAIPIWILLRTGSLFRFGLYSLVGLVPGLLVAPVAGAIVDRVDRRMVMLAGDCAAGVIQLALFTLLVSGHLRSWHLYALLGCLSIALTFQRLAYGSAVAQLVPKQFLGHANGVVQLAGGMAQFLVPLVAVALLAAIDLKGILLIDVMTYAVAIVIVLFVRFPKTLPWRRRETLGAEISHGFTYAWRQRNFRMMLLYFAALNIFLAPVLTLITPLVLSFGTVHTVARVAIVAGLGTTAGGLVMGLWGGPSHRRMHGVMVGTVVFAVCCFVTGLAANVWVVAAGAFGMYAALTIINGVYTTIIQVKVPQRFHGRVFAINTLVAWSTLPLGFAVVAPFGAKLFEPLMKHNGPLAGSVGKFIGTGPGRGIGLMYLVFAVSMVGLVLVAVRLRGLAGFDDEVPDAPADDLVGAQIRAERIAAEPQPVGSAAPVPASLASAGHAS